MYISVSDLEFLIHLENRLGASESWSADVERLWQLNDKLVRQRESMNEKTRRVVAERRKSDKTYGRSKKS